MIFHNYHFICSFHERNEKAILQEIINDITKVQKNNINAAATKRRKSNFI